MSVAKHKTKRHVWAVSQCEENHSPEYYATKRDAEAAQRHAKFEGSEPSAVWKEDAVKACEDRDRLRTAIEALLLDIDPDGHANDPDISTHRPIIAARAAIAKARGEGGGA